MYAEKLLANADRWADRSVMSRDIIDLSMMISAWGKIPEESWNKVIAAYGDNAVNAYTSAVTMINDQRWLEQCLTVHGTTVARTKTRS